ncbi:MAG: glycosyltransferase family 9 protein, partial [Ignavibacteriaceae bacterium]
DFMVQKSTVDLKLFVNRNIPEVAALVSKSDLFISNDTGIMHVAGTTATPQISVFGPTNPFNWAPIGEKKLFIRKSDLIDDITVDDVFDLCKTLLKRG